VAQSKYLGTAVTYQNVIQEEIKRKLNSANACYGSVQNRLSFCLLSKNIKDRICKSIIFTCGSGWVRNLVSDIKGEQGAEENICTQER
jgi:hypothetical protein